MTAIRAHAGAEAPMIFEFATAARIRFGPGAVRGVPELAAKLGRRLLLVTGRSTDRARGFAQALEAAGLESIVFPVAGEPTTADVLLGQQTARRGGVQLVISFGGGSAIDAGKAIAALLPTPGDLLDYLEVIGQGRELEQPSAPFIAIPTTAGTGTEVTRNAVLASPEHRVKVSLRSPLLLPRLAVVDPELTYDLPPAVTASTGLDALTQLIEPFVSGRANPITDAFCRDGLRRAARSLRTACRLAGEPRSAASQPPPELKTARADMALASLLSGLALANAGLGAVHGFAAPIGGRFAAPHGAVCAALLPHVLAINLSALRQRAPDDPAIGRFSEIARLLTGERDVTAEDGIRWVHDLVRDLVVPPLGHYGIARAHLGELVGAAAHASSMKANPIALTDEELGAVLSRAL
jgi:alcohol dehydrogenase class IV